MNYYMLYVVLFHNVLVVASFLLDNGKDYPASPSSSGGDQTNIIICSSNHTHSQKVFKVLKYIVIVIVIESQDTAKRV